MSDALYMTRLRWDGRRGIAKLHGHLVLLQAAPDLGQGPVCAVDYIPEVHLQLIQPRAGDAPRDWMAPEEIAAADRLLAVLCSPDPRREDSSNAGAYVPGEVGAK